jgi:hypothetical protein
MGKGVLLGAAGSFPADWYLLTDETLSSCTKILRWRLG